MKMRYVAVACAATAILLLSACGDGDDSSTTTSEPSTTPSEAADDGPTTLVRGDDVELVGDDGLGGQTLNISARAEDGGELSGGFQVSENAIML